MSVWYAVMRDDADEDDSFGSYDFEEAKALCEEMYYTTLSSSWHIRVYTDTWDPICIGEIRRPFD